jgi:hypothetical protein
MLDVPPLQIDETLSSVAKARTKFWNDTSISSRFHYVGEWLLSCDPGVEHQSNKFAFLNCPIIMYEYKKNLFKTH